MAGSTLILLLCLFSLVADSFLFDILDTLKGADHTPPRLPFPLFVDMFKPKSTPLPLFERDPRGRHYQYDVITFTEPTTTTTTASTPTTSFEEVVDEIFGKKTEKDEKKVDQYFMKNVKVSEVIKDKKEHSPEPNALSAHERTTELDPILSVLISRENIVSDETTTTSRTNNIDNFSESTNYNKNDRDLFSKGGIFAIPVNAIIPSVASDGNVNSLKSDLEPAQDNFQTRSQVASQNVVSQSVPIQPNLYTMNTGTANIPNQIYGSSLPSSYSLVNLPNGMQGISLPNNNVYLLNTPNNVNTVGSQSPNGQPIYSLIPLNSQPNNLTPLNQPNNFAGINQPQNLIMLNNQLYSISPLNTQANNVPINNNFVPLNNQPNRIILVNNGQPNNFLPNGNNFIPVSNQGNFVPLNNNNFIPLNNQPTYVAANVPSNIVPVNNLPNSIAPVNGQPLNYITLNNQPNNPSPVVVQPAPNPVMTRDEDPDDEKVEDKDIFEIEK